MAKEKSCEILRRKIHRFGRGVRRARIGYLRWQNAHLPQSVVLVMIALFIGVSTGIAAAALKELVRLLNSMILADVRVGQPDFRLLLWPVAGIFLTGIYQRYVVRGSVARGTRIIRQDLDTGRYLISPFTIFNPVVGCSVTIGTGSTGGTEGPTALSGAAIGSVVGRFFGLSSAWLRLLVGIGAGAGIAAIFKSPVGGVLFVLEVLQLEMSSLPVLALIIACLLASTTAYLLSDFTFDIFFDRTLPFDPHMLGWVMLLGVFCGLYSVYYTYTKSRATRLFTAIRNPWLASAVTGGAMSVGVFMFPLLFGEGFNVITSLVNGSEVSFTAAGILAGHDGFFWMLAGLLAVMLLKGVLVAASYCGGGVAGDFVPTFFAGSLAGYLFSVLCDVALGTHLPAWFFALTGMGAVMAGTLHAPLMSIFILCETTDTFGYIFPYLIAVVVSYATVKLVTPRSWYGETGHDDLMALISKRKALSLRADAVRKRSVSAAPGHSRLRTSDKTIPDRK